MSIMSSSVVCCCLFPLLPYWVRGKVHQAILYTVYEFKIMYYSLDSVWCVVLQADILVKIVLRRRLEIG